jgi:hypothetical protein
MRTSITPKGPEAHTLAQSGDNIPRQKLAGLIHFDDARTLHDRRLFLTMGKALGALTVDIDAREFLAIMVIHGHLPMLMPAATILA